MLLVTQWADDLEFLGPCDEDRVPLQQYTILLESCLVAWGAGSYLSHSYSIATSHRVPSDVGNSWKSWTDYSELDVVSQPVIHSILSYPE